MSFSISEVSPDPPDSVYVPANEGITKWFSGDVYTVRLMATNTNGALGIIEASVPPGNGPVAHAHTNGDETFYMLSGELEFLHGNETFIASPGDLLFVPRGTRHRFKNIGLHPARLLFMYTPGGTEGQFIEGGDEPEPGVNAPPWGGERNNEHYFELLRKYGTEELPEDP
jgi:quercetin dioxygenase-like cupin family protein